MKRTRKTDTEPKVLSHTSGEKKHTRSKAESLKDEPFRFVFEQKDEPHTSVIESVCGLEPAGESAESKGRDHNLLVSASVNYTHILLALALARSSSSNTNGGKKKSRELIFDKRTLLFFI